MEAKPVTMFLVPSFVSLAPTYSSVAPTSHSMPSGQRSLRLGRKKAIPLTFPFSRSGRKLFEVWMRSRKNQIFKKPVYLKHTTGTLHGGNLIFNVGGVMFPMRNPLNPNILKVVLMWSDGRTSEMCGFSAFRSRTSPAPFNLPSIDQEATRATRECSICLQSSRHTDLNSCAYSQLDDPI